MRNWKDRIRNYAAIQRVSAFLITLSIIYLFLPKEGLFKYEYQLNQPWKHERLLAPFDFGIKKTKAQLELERQQTIDKQPLVFVYDASITNQVLARIDQQVIGGISDSLISCDSAINQAVDVLAIDLSRGLIERNVEQVSTLQPFDPVLLQQNGQIKKYEYGDLPTIQSLLTRIDSSLQQINDSACRSLIQQAMVSSIRPNFLYNDSLTKRLTQSALDGIIEVEGRIDRGTAIIDKGDIVNESKLKTLQSLEAEYKDRVLSSTGIQWSLIGEMGVIAILLILLLLFIYLNQGTRFNDPRPMTLTLSLLAMSFIFSTLAISSDVISIYAIPLGIAPLLLRMFYDIKVSIFTHLISVLIIALFASNPLEFMVIQVGAMSFATLYQAASTKRSRMLTTAFIVFTSYSVIYVLMSIAQTGNLASIQNEYFGWFAINALLCTLVFPLIYIVEKIFGYTSETTLLELSESNQPLLKELAIKAPGTFQHSLQVANLCEKVAREIGGDAVLLRTAAMYHDVGKMNEPQFFIENQLPDNNPHEDLEPAESAAIIINHVTKGVELCREANLPMDIIQFIQTHHGTSSVRFFLKKAHAKAELTGNNVDSALFTYPGPTPKTKEQAILMMADSVEAASRTLKQYDKETINGLVDGLIDFQRSEGQFEDAPITYKDITIAKRTLKSALHGIFHQRISYD
ncbi:MAG: HDIG domain-containing protein [Salibacteraceae bacterium]